MAKRLLLLAALACAVGSVSPAPCLVESIWKLERAYTRLVDWASSFRGLKEERGGHPSDIVFELFTRRNADEPRALKLGDADALKRSPFDGRLPTRIFAHGYFANSTSGYRLRDAYLAKEECNFISVDWSALAYSFDYSSVAQVNVPRAGAHVAAFVDFLVASAPADLETIHLIGFSLGAHVMGKAGASVRAGKIARLTGLDPAGPFFNNDDTENRLDPSDAVFIDVIQTNAYTYGYGDPIGHVDFYPNGGMFQPGCVVSDLVETYLRHPPLVVKGQFGCSHGRAVSYFVESIDSPIGFVATACESWTTFQSGSCLDNDRQLMGQATPPTARGVYYLVTNAESPYALAHSRPSYS